ncbi:MAG: adenylyl-sulfate kinase [Aeromicrobium sp.]
MATVPKLERSYPQHSPSLRELDDVELLRMGALAPLLGFEGEGGEVTLAVPIKLVEWAIDAGGLEIVDPEGVPLAVLSIEETYPITADLVGASGPIRPLPGTIRRAFSNLYVSPSQTRGALDAATLTVPVDAPLTNSDLADIRSRANGGPVLLVVLAGNGSPRELSPHGLIRATLAAARDLDNAKVVAIPVAARRVPTLDQDFRQHVVRSYAPGEDILWPLSLGEVSAAVSAVIEHDRPTGSDQGLVVFFTGLSGSGKSTISQAFRDTLLEQGVRTVSLLDGDLVRRNLSAGLTFSREDRETNIERIGWVAAEIARHGGLAICSPIAPFDRTRKIARHMAEEVGAVFVLVHLATPLAECERRDRKGLYAKARRGEIEQFTGISSPYEIPADAEVDIDTTGRSVDDVLTVVLDFLTEQGLLPRGIEHHVELTIGSPS